MPAEISGKLLREETEQQQAVSAIYKTRKGFDEKEETTTKSGEYF